MKYAVFKVIVPHLGSQMGKLMVSASVFIQATLKLLRKRSLLLLLFYVGFFLANTVQNGGGLERMLMPAKGRAAATLLSFLYFESFCIVMYLS